MLSKELVNFMHTQVGQKAKSPSQLNAEIAKELAELKKKSSLDVQHSSDTQLFKLHVGHSIFASDTLRLDKNFTAKIQTELNSDVNYVGFPPQKHIIKWLADKTESHSMSNFSDLVDDVREEEFCSVLLSVVYFRAKWFNEFKRYVPVTFICYDGQSVQVNMLEKTFSCGISVECPSLSASVCQVPFQNNGLTMTIVLPNEGIDINTVLKQLNASLLSQVLGKKETKYVRLQMPKIKLEFEYEVGCIFILFDLFNSDYIN